MGHRSLLLVGALLGTAGCAGAATAGERTETAPTASITAPATTAAAATAEREYCRSAEAFVDLPIEFDQAAVDPVGHERALDALAAGYAALRAGSPDALAADWELVGQAYAEFFAAFAAVDYQVFGLVADPAAAAMLERLGAQDVLAASARIETATLAACGVALGLGDAADASADSGGGPVERGPASTFDDAGLTQLGADLLAGFGVVASPEQQLCLGRAVSDPSFDPAAATGDGPLAAYRLLADGCGIAMLFPS